MSLAAMLKKTSEDRKSGGAAARRLVATATPYGGGFAFDSYRHLEQYRHYRGYTYSIVRTIATRVSGQPLRVGRILDKSAPAKDRPVKGYVPSMLKGMEENITLYKNHPILQAFHKPNPVMVRWIAMYVTVASLQITGKAFWWMSRNDDGTPEIWPIPAHWCQPVHTEETLFAYWHVQPDGSPAFKVRGKDMVYFYLPDISDPLAAYGPADALARTIAVDEQTEESQRRSLMNSMNPALAITVGRSSDSSPIASITDAPVLSRAQRKALKATLRQEYQGMLNADEPMILDGFIRDIKSLRTTPREIDFKESSIAIKSRLAQGYGVNPITMGETEGANRASSAVADDHFLLNVVNPLLVLLGEIMSSCMPRFFTGRKDEIVYIEPARSNDADYDLEVEKEFLDRGAMSINEARSRHGLPPIEDGESSIVNGIGRVDIRHATSLSPKAQPVKRKKGVLKSKIDDETLSEAYRAASQAADDRSVSMATQFISSMCSEAIRNAEGFITHPPTELAAQATATLDLEPIIKAMTPLYSEEVRRAAAFDIALYAPPEKSFVEDGMRAVGNMISVFVHHLRHLPFWRFLVKKIGAAVTAAVLAADASKTSRIEAIKSEIGLKFVGQVAFDLVNSDLPPATETGRDIAYRHLLKVGSITGRVWTTKKDSRVRKTHKEASGQIADGESPFVISGYTCRYPRDPSLPPEERVRCRCIALNILA